MAILKKFNSFCSDAASASKDRGWHPTVGPFLIIWKYLMGHILMQCAHIFPAKISPFFHRLRGVKIGENCFIHNSVIIDEAFPEQIEIGNDVRIAAGTVIIGHMKPGKELRENYLPTRVAKVKIEDHCFIGVNCVIMPGVKVREGSVIVSGSVVMTNTKKFTVFSGNPAKKLKELTRIKTED